MSEHTPLPWTESGHSDFRGADNHLIGMVNPTGGEVSPKRAKVDRALILLAVNNHDALVKTLAIFLNGEERFQVAVGGNPNAVDKMLESAREVLARASQCLAK